MGGYVWWSTAAAPRRRPRAPRNLPNPVWSGVAGGRRLDRDARRSVVEAGFAIVGEQPHLGGHVILLEAE